MEVIKDSPWGPVCRTPNLRITTFYVRRTLTSFNELSVKGLDILPL